METSGRVIAFINLAHGLDHLMMLIFPTAVLAMGPALGIPYEHLLTLSMGGFIAFGVGSMPAGWLGDRWNRRHMLAVFFWGVGTSAIATGFARTPLHIALGLTMMGLFSSIYHPVGTALLVTHAEKIGREIGRNGVFGNLGVAGAALLTGAITEWLGWRWAFFIPGLLALLAGAVFCGMVPSEANRPRRPRHADVTFPRTVIIRAFIALAGMTLANGMVFNATTVSLPKLFDERLPRLASSTLSVGLLVAMVYVVGALSQLLIGRLLDRFPIKIAFLPLAIMLPFLAFAVSVLDGWALLAVTVALVFVIFGQITINDGTVAKYAGESWRARVFAVRYVITFGVSAAAVPLVAGMHTAAFTGLFQVLAGFGGLVLVCALLFPYRPDEIVH